MKHLVYTLVGNPAGGYMYQRTAEVESPSPRPLDCAICGRDYFTFNSLAYHVKSVHGQSVPGRSPATPKEHPMPSRPVRRPAPARSTARAASTMPPPRQSTPQGSRAGTMPTPNASQTQGLPFLTPAAVGANPGDQATILFHGLPARNARGTFGPQLAYKVTLGNEDFQFCIDLEGRNHNALYRMFHGAEPSGEIDVEIVLSKNQRPYLVIVEPETK